MKGRGFFRRLTSYARLLVYANPSKLDYALLVVGTIASIAAGVPFPVLGILFGELIDDINSATCAVDPSGSPSYQNAVNDKVLTVTYIGLGQLCFIYTYILCWNLSGERLAQRLRETYFLSLLRQEPSFFDDLPSGEVSSRLNNEITTIQDGTSQKVGIVLQALSFFVTAYVIAFIKDAKLGGMLVSLVPAFMAMTLIGSYYIGKYSGAASKFVAASASIASEALSNILVVHAFNANTKLEARFSQKLIGAKESGVKKAVATSIQSGVLYFVAYAANALAFWQGSRTIAAAVANGNSGATVGTTYTVIFILIDATLVLSSVAPFIQVFGAAQAGFSKLEEHIDHKSKIDGTSDTIGVKLERVHGDVELRNVSFTYPSRPDTQVLKDVSLICPAGKQTAIIGLSGSGKSTIAALVTRLYDPERGAVYLDGHDLTQLNVKSLRSHFSLVQQEPSLLDRSILENIAHGLINSHKHAHLHATLVGPALADFAADLRRGMSMEETARLRGKEVVEIVDLVVDAAKLADADGFIRRLQAGYGTTTGSKGLLISGGQKQRISIARALVKDPAVLVLDEATASLDSVSELRIQADLEKVAVGRTVIVIAHRLSTIQNSDNIIVMRNGGVVEQGSHTVLLEQDGAYADLLRLQNLSKEDMKSLHSSRSTLTLNEDSSGKVKEVVTKKNSAPSEDNESDPPAVEDRVNSDDVSGGLGKSRSLWSIIKALAPLFRRYVIVLILAFTAALVVGSTYSASALIFGNTVGALSPCEEASSIRSAGRFFGLMFFVLALVEFFANIVSWSGFGWIAERVLFKVRVLMFRTLLEQDLQWHQSEGRSPLILLNFITRDGGSLGGLTGSIIGTILSILVNLVIAIILTHVVAWKIAIVCLAGVPIILGFGYMQLVVLARFEAKHQEAFARSVGITVEAVEQIKTVAIHGLEEETVGSYRRSLQGPIRETTRRTAYATMWLALAIGFPTFIYALAYWWGTTRIIAGDYDQVQFFIVVLALLMSAQLWGQMFALAPDVSRAKAAVSRILNLLDLGSEKKLSGRLEDFQIEDKDEVDPEKVVNIAEKVPPASGGVSVGINSVEFAYPARPEVQVLHGMSIDVKSGQFCALVGPSGAGKSTIIALLERMYHPSSGSVHIDGVDIATREGSSFRDQVALVPQDSVLFEGTVRFNVALGVRPGEEASDRDIEEACKLANIHDTIMNMPDGYNTDVGPGGSQLSGGQKQRLAIARALIRKPRLLLLDESTSALDAESEQLLQAGLERAARNITVIAIAHRLHTIRKADVIFLIESGRCVDRGTHDELLLRSESYRVNAMHQAVDA
ncbi:Leptomycin B resistance protein pmd1 [Cyphellophora attinorum]|uniref:Leptomycin B resistance protein pmd1 n=1 Tax=Cyphellophora attinorum TaxID=1664694 RepID=A0A0N1P0I7_9EURO|nr:Leptomycin B resistance protein pmd1 [Phialophora attinorum]KPI42307.1 Leptomycin B resistance protein pmd1 [Phialophora attinorum]